MKNRFGLTTHKTQNSVKDYLTNKPSDKDANRQIL